MTREERWVIVGLAWLILFGCGVERWRREADARGWWSAAPERRAETISAVREDPETVPSPPIDLNRCDAGDLERLPGIGPVRAARIVEWREKHGPFLSVKDLVRVSGVGEKTLARVESLIVAGAAEENP